MSPIVSPIVWVYETATDGWGKITRCYQEHNGQVSSSPYIGYAWGDGLEGSAAKYVRLESVTYPDLRTIYYKYPSSGIGAALVRVETIANTGGDTQHLAEYAYLGAGTVVSVEYPNVTDRPALQYAPATDWDRFGHVLNHQWKLLDGAQTVLDRFTYGYDAGSNRLFRKNEVNTAFSELYHANAAAAGTEYDALNRLVKFYRGTLADGNGSVTSNYAGAQQFFYDQLGNWAAFKDDATDGGTWDVDQTRTHDLANELVSTAGTGVSKWCDPNYDAAGNMTSGPDPRSSALAADPNFRQFYFYDAWNRQVKVSRDTNANGVYDAGADANVAVYYYDGRGYRVAKAVPNAANPALWDRTDFYYNESWQVLDERGSAGQAAPTTVATTAKYQYVWDLRYIDSPVLRRDDTSLGSPTWLFYLNDVNFNVTALVRCSDGAVVERYVYDPYGKVTVCDAAWTARTPNASAYDNAILYCGYRYEPETGDYHIRMRRYHPLLGLWLSQEPSSPWKKAGV